MASTSVNAVTSPPEEKEADSLWLVAVREDFVLCGGDLWKDPNKPVDQEALGVNKKFMNAQLANDMPCWICDTQEEVDTVTSLLLPDSFEVLRFRNYFDLCMYDPELWINYQGRHSNQETALLEAHYDVADS